MVPPRVSRPWNNGPIYRAAHACEIVLIYRGAITRSHILGSRLQERRSSTIQRWGERKEEILGRGRRKRRHTCRKKRTWNVKGWVRKRLGVHFDSRGACSDNASVAFYANPPSSFLLLQPWNPDFYSWNVIFNFYRKIGYCFILL